MIRIAKPTDAGEMLRIYFPFILHSGITQETEIPSVPDFEKRIASTLVNFPWLVYETENGIAGYAYASRYRERSGYQWCVETSVYIGEKWIGQQLGVHLYKVLVDILKLQGYVNAYAVITLPNDHSVKFHENFGYTHFATYKDVGFKLGKWHDVGWWVYFLNDHDAQPALPLRFSSLDSSAIELILKK